jgi:VanZ family protein
MSAYPVVFSVDYPERKLSRVSTAFRLFAVIPIAVVAGLLQSAEFGASWEVSALFLSSAMTGAGIIVFPLVLMVLFRRKYPRWWYEWNLELLRFTNRIAVYIALMDDRYPSTDEKQAVHLDFPYPDASRLSRGMPLVKWLLAIPHYFALAFLLVLAIMSVIVAWFAILLTGRYPRGIFTFIEGILRWNLRVVGYAFVLVTDEYPPFRLAP